MTASRGGTDFPRKARHCFQYSGFPVFTEETGASSNYLRNRVWDTEQARDHLARTRAAKVLLVLLSDRWSDDWAVPYIEYQRRFPINWPFDGDNRVSFGLMLALCTHCGLN